MASGLNNYLSLVLRSAIEVLYRSKCLLKHIDDIDPIRARSYGPLLNPTSAYLERNDRILLKTMVTAKDCLSNTDKNAHERMINQLRTSLSVHSDTFRVIHEHLAYLPAEDALPEAAFVLENVFGGYFNDDKPCIILDSLFCAYEFPFLENLRRQLPRPADIVGKTDRSKVLALALCDRNSPLGWAVLAHEYGHAIEQDINASVDFRREVAKQRGISLEELDRTGERFSISDEIAHKYEKNIQSENFQHAKNWCTEIFADLIAAKAMGPPAILAILSLEFCMLPCGERYKPLPTHPPTAWRIFFTRRFLRQMGTSNRLTSLSKVFFKALQYEQVLDNQDVSALKKETEWIYYWYKRWGRRLASDVGAYVHSHIELSCPTFDPKSIERCLDRLNKNRPIGTQGPTKLELQEQLSTYNLDIPNDPSRRKKQFYKLVGQFAEEPLPVSTILLAGYEHRYQIIQDFIESFLSSKDSVEDIVSDSIVRMQKADDKLIASIRSSEVSGRLIEDINAKRTDDKGVGG